MAGNRQTSAGPCHLDAGVVEAGVAAEIGEGGRRQRVGGAPVVGVARPQPLGQAGDARLEVGVEAQPGDHLAVRVPHPHALAVAQAARRRVVGVQLERHLAAPQVAEVLNERAGALMALGRHDEALAALDRAIALRAGYAGALANRGRALKELKRPQEALQSYDEALRFNPRFALALTGRGTALAELGRQYAKSGGLQLVEVAGGYQIVTRPELHEWVRRLFHERTTQKLSVQALETLAVIAYKQPITAMEITEIRGVNTTGVVGTLLERGLVKIAGRKQVVGRPFLYATTREFLDRFGLKDLTDLPKVEDMADALGFEPPAGLGVQASLDEVAGDEPATEEDRAVLSGERAPGEEPGDEQDE